MGHRKEGARPNCRFAEEGAGSTRREGVEAGALSQCCPASLAVGERKSTSTPSVRGVGAIGTFGSAVGL